jgi:hypothetical protein
MIAHLASGIRPQAAYAFSLDPAFPAGTRGLPRVFHWSGWKRRHWPAEVIRPGILLYGFDKRTRTLSVLLRVERGGTFTYRSRPEFSRRVRELTGIAPSTADPYWPTLPILKKGNPCTGIVVKCQAMRQVQIPWRGRFNRLGWERVIVAPFERLGADIGNPSPMRCAFETTRVLRDTAVTRYLKRLHRDTCQVCRKTLRLFDGTAYSEAHHLRPLGKPHNGPDIPPNVIVVCPNCHALCDMGGIQLSASRLRSRPGHEVDPRFLRYHNSRVCGIRGGPPEPPIETDAKGRRGSSASR